MDEPPVITVTTHKTHVKVPLRLRFREWRRRRRLKRAGLLDLADEVDRELERLFLYGSTSTGERPMIPVESPDERS
jgi:hypothetical protein